MVGRAPGDRRPLLSVADLHVHYRVPRRGFAAFGSDVVRAVDGVSFDLYAGETLAIVGESGCGKSSLARALLRLAPITSGTVSFDGSVVSGLAERELSSFRRNVQMVFQDPYSSLNPYQQAWEIVTEPQRNYGLRDRDTLYERAGQLLEMVGLARSHAEKFPHQFSGGQRQRLGIARAICLDPKLIVCDEAVAALDVSVQAQILNLLAELRRNLGISYLFISHDLGVVAHLADRTAVMYLGKIVEVGPTRDMFRQPRHPYTQALLDAVPRIGGGSVAAARRRLQGSIPSPLNPPTGCRFHTRCWMPHPACSQLEPVLEGAGHRVACHAVDPDSTRSTSVPAVRP